MQYAFFLLAAGLWFSLAGCNMHEPPLFPLMDTSCDNSPIPDEKFLNYIEHPDAIDTTCSGDLRRAEKAFAEGKLSFSLYVGQGLGGRYQEELEKLCMVQGLTLHRVVSGCLLFPGQTNGCYGAFMDKKIMERYGKNFKCQLINKADSIFLANTILNDDAVYRYFCDTLPVLPSKFYGNRYMILFKNGKPYELLVKDGPMETPNFQMEIVIEKNGTISRLSKADQDKLPYMPPNYFWLKDEVVDQIFDFIKKEYTSWKPGQIKGVPVRTIFTMNIFISGT